VASAVFKTVARPHKRSRVGSTPMHSRQPNSYRPRAIRGAGAESAAHRHNARLAT